MQDPGPARCQLGFALLHPWGDPGRSQLQPAGVPSLLTALVLQGRAGEPGPRGLPGLPVSGRAAACRLGLQAVPSCTHRDLGCHHAGGLPHLITLLGGEGLPVGYTSGCSNIFWPCRELPACGGWTVSPGSLVWLGKQEQPACRGLLAPPGTR